MKFQYAQIIGKIVTCIFCLVVFSGLLYQAYLLTASYFSFKVSTKIDISIPPILDPQAVSLCTRWTDVLNYDHFNRDTQFSYNLSYTQELSQVYRIQAILTAGQIFNYTPKENIIIDWVQYRKAHDYELHELSRIDTKIEEQFKVVKYLYLEYVCYLIRQTQPQRKKYISLSETPTTSGMIYQIKISKFLYRSHLMKISGHSNHLMPLRSLVTQPVVSRHFNPRANKSAYNEFILHIKKMSVNGMEYPYETNCFNYSKIGMRGETDCAQRCILEATIGREGKLPFSVPITQSNDHIDRRIISYLDVKDKQIGRRVMKVRDDCHLQCSRLQCDYRFAMTKVISKDSEFFVIRFMVPTSPWITINSSASYTLLEYITYIFSVIATWTGMSVYHFNPIRGYQKWKMLRLRYSKQKKETSRELDMKNMKFRYRGRWIVSTPVTIKH